MCGEGSKVFGFGGGGSLVVGVVRCCRNLGLGKFRWRFGCLFVVLFYSVFFFGV